MKKKKLKKKQPDMPKNNCDWSKSIRFTKYKNTKIKMKNTPMQYYLKKKKEKSKNNIHCFRLPPRGFFLEYLKQQFIPTVTV